MVSGRRGGRFDSVALLRGRSRTDATGGEFISVAGYSHWTARTFADLERAAGNHLALLLLPGGERGERDGRSSRPTRKRSRTRTFAFGGGAVWAGSCSLSL